ncbi:LOW QUALITY PROTEIN: GRB10-interacting GYF protein 2 [Gouania willdenowi]|uniref:LOW QUALITY PROTEIN: GRB10-interacting GYF protein 2 n=1 Tax=Gouania willdenowi TaxID=441366 RepID=UPI001056A17E|nr:LOW QUALITY PROTEIN: GRB10-interacting GYF protein 2 [Gouania willdenowi]
MAETQTLNFGPEWLRALSGGGVGGGGGGGGGSSGIMASPPLSPVLPKYKLADYRYGREEMLALYIKDNKIPLDLHDKEFLPILQEEPLPPLALVSFTEEEQRNFSMSVNSAAVLRLSGRGGGPIVGVARGRSTSRGRGRGRGDAGFYQRSLDDVEGFGRGGREMHRSQSWEERGDRRFEKPGRKDPADAAPGHFQINHIRGNYEDVVPGLPRKHDFTRSESENWRTSRDEQNGWREHPDQRRRFPFDIREDERGYRRPRSGSGSLEDERDSLPEWCLEDADEEAGTFDSSGAFLSLKKTSKEPIFEEVELDFKPLEECEESLEEEETPTKETEAQLKRQAEHKEEAPPAAPPVPEPPAPTTSTSPKQSNRIEESERVPLHHVHVPISNSTLESLPRTHISTTLTDVSTPSPTVQLPQQKSMDVTSPRPFPSSPLAAIRRPAAAVTHDAEEDGLKHFEQEAEKMVAYLQDSGVDDDRLTAKLPEKPKPAAGLPLTHEAALKWFYKDPQGEIQGPFSNQEMTEWFQAGYFTMSLLVKRGCDEVFQPLGEIMKMWGRVPFTPGPAPPPLQGDGGQERVKRQQELSALNLYQLQQLQFQYLLRQQYAQVLAQQKAAALSSAPLQQQQQHEQQINLLLQQYQTLKIRASENPLPPVTCSLSVPDSGSVWEMQNPSSQASCAAALPQPAPSTWDGSSVWDLPIDSVAQAPTIEQMQQFEKTKSAKLELERHEAEIRAKREEEERKRLEEVLRARQEEERKRLEEEELARQKQEEALRRQREQEEAQRRQEEEKERQEEALRRAEERRREEEERRKVEEFLRKQDEERRRQEELETLRRREEEKRAEEEAAAAAAALAQHQQQEEQKRREQEAQRQQELQRQRQQQQEALRRLQQQQQQQQLAQMKLPSSSKWGQQSASSSNQTHNALSLAEIQKLEEERERQAQEERHQQQEFLKLQLQQQALQQAQQAQAKLPGWGNVAKQPAITKSLLEIQREEAQQMKQRKQQQQQQNTVVTQQSRPQSKTVPLSSSVWGSVSTSTNWGSDSSSIWGDTHNSNMGFWDEAVKESVQQPVPSRKGNVQKNNKGNANLSNSVSGRVNKKVEEEEKLLKLFQGVNKSHQDTFMQWCEQTLHLLNTANNLDVPTFASFLKEVDSPYEVHDYVRAYLGDTPEAKDFAKQFLERRAKQNANQQKTAPQSQQQALKQQQLQDSVWGGGTGSSPLYQSNHVVQQQRFETVTSGKKKKKQKMVRADPSLLGFSVNASSERLNMGEIETLEDV